MATKKARTNKDERFAQFEAEGFVRLNPEPRYYNAEGADPLFCVVVDRQVLKSKKGKGENAFYTCIAMRPCKNGPMIDKDTGEQIETSFEPGDTVRVGARHQIEDTFHRIVGKAALVLVQPLAKVATSTGREVWQFFIAAKPLSAEERELFAQFNLSDFDAL